MPLKTYETQIFQVFFLRNADFAKILLFCAESRWVIHVWINVTVPSMNKTGFDNTKNIGKTLVFGYNGSIAERLLKM